MKGYRLSFLILLAASLLPLSCNRKQADLPDAGELLSHIRYLDSLVQSELVDSIDRVNNGLSANLMRYTNRAQTPDDKSILDSLGHIHTHVNQFLRFCEETPANLEIMEQDVRTARSQYLSGKMNMATYVSNLLQHEQLLVDINAQVTDQIGLMRIYLSIQDGLTRQLNPLPNNE